MTIGWPLTQIKPLDVRVAARSAEDGYDPALWNFQ